MPFRSETEMLAPYRFMDDGTEADETNGDKVLVVEFYPSIDDLVTITQTQANKFPQRPLTKWGLQGFVVLNLAMVPALLFYAEMFIAAIALFVINLTIAVFVLPNLAKTEYRRFYEFHFPNFEQEVVRVELHNNGVSCSHLSDSSFYSWQNFTHIVETEDSIHLYMTGGRGMAVRKNGFANDHELKVFLAFSGDRIPAKQITDASRSN